MSGVELLGHVRGRAQMLRASIIAVTPSVMGDGADRWVLASLLQKAIRRGQCELALGASLKLLEIDPSRLWRRLMTVALEDVGVGDLDVALDLVAVSVLPGPEGSWVEVGQASRSFTGQAGRRGKTIAFPWACRAMKDRTADHLASLVRWRGLSTSQDRDAEHEAVLLPSQRGVRGGRTPRHPPSEPLAWYRAVRWAGHAGRAGGAWFGSWR